MKYYFVHKVNSTLADTVVMVAYLDRLHAVFQGFVCVAYVVTFAPLSFSYVCPSHVYILTSVNINYHFRYSVTVTRTS